MSVQPSKSEYLKDLREEYRLERKELYEPRWPTDDLPDEYYPTESNPEPPLVHFAFPVDVEVLYAYADRHNLTEYLPQLPNTKAPATLFSAVEHLSRYARYELEFWWPFRATADCDVILVLYDNYTIEDKMLIEEDEEDVIRRVQKALRFDKTVRPKWYFDFYDPWTPESDEDV